ncbi:MAG: septum formation initiator family protein [bacterium]|nr:septum formation initiator family protein [bacterium]
MKELQRRQYIKRLVYSWPALVLLVLVAFFLAKGAVGMIAKERQSAGRVAELDAKATALALREQSLEAGIAKLGTEEGILEEIKDKFSVTREGEYVAIIVDEKSKDKSAENKEIWYKKLWNAIIGK